MEQAKRVVQEIAKYPNRPETIRISLVPRGHHTYVDLRVYRAGKATRQGLVIHEDLLPPVLAALQQVLRAGYTRLSGQDRTSVVEPTWGAGQTEVYFPADIWEPDHDG